MFNITAEELESIQVGDTVYYEHSVSYLKDYKPTAVVEKITKTLIVCKGIKFRRNTGVALSTNRFDLVQITKVEKKNNAE